jgi:hypothetical protein
LPLSAHRRHHHHAARAGALRRRPRDTRQPRFDSGQIDVLQALQKKLQGRTRKQQNLHPPDSLAWAGRTIAGLGGWTGYESDKSTGPITMRDGLERFHGIVDGYNLAKNVCPS